MAAFLGVGQLLSKLYRKAEALDGACLRAWGHPHDHAIREELLSALEWESSLRPEHARSQIRELFTQAHDRSADLAKRIQSGAVTLGGEAQPVPHSIERLRRSLAKLMHVLEAHRAESHRAKAN